MQNKLTEFELVYCTNLVITCKGTDPSVLVTNEFELYNYQYNRICLELLFPEKKEKGMSPPFLSILPEIFELHF